MIYMRGIIKKPLTFFDVPTSSTQTSCESDRISNLVPTTSCISFIYNNIQNVNLCLTCTVKIDCSFTYYSPLFYGRNAIIFARQNDRAFIILFCAILPCLCAILCRKCAVLLNDYSVICTPKMIALFSFRFALSYPVYALSYVESALLCETNALLFLPPNYGTILRFFLRSPILFTRYLMSKARYCVELMRYNLYAKN